MRICFWAFSACDVALFAALFVRRGFDFERLREVRRCFELRRLRFLLSFFLAFLDLPLSFFFRLSFECDRDLTLRRLRRFL